jgi:hypothetical protein
MCEAMDKNNYYLDFDGLKKYDELIKNYIIYNDNSIAESAASAIASIVDDAPESFDTLKKVADWISNNDYSSDVKNILMDISVLKEIDHNAYISADENLEISLKGYVDDKFVVKQDIIPDLDTIRSGAAAGSSALQEVPDEYVTEDELLNKEFATTTQVENLISGSINIVSDVDIDNIFK